MNLAETYTVSDLKRILGITKQAAERILKAKEPRFTLAEAELLLNKPLPLPESRLKATVTDTDTDTATIMSIKGTRRKIEVPYKLEPADSYTLLADIFTTAEFYRLRTRSPMFDKTLDAWELKMELEFSRKVYDKLKSFLGDEYEEEARRFCDIFCKVCPDRIRNPTFLPANDTDVPSGS